MIFRPSAKSISDLRKAVRRYNMMRTQAYTRYGILTIAPAESTSEILSRVVSTQEVRSEIRRLSDYKRIADFELFGTPELKATVGEIRTFKRLSAADKARRTKRANVLRQKLPTATTAEIVKIQQELVKLQSENVPLSNIKKRETLNRVTAALQAKSHKYNYRALWRFRQTLTEMVADAGKIVDNYIGVNEGTTADKIRKKINRLSLEELQGVYEYVAQQQYDVYQMLSSPKRQPTRELNGERVPRIRIKDPDGNYSYYEDYSSANDGLLQHGDASLVILGNINDYLGTPNTDLPSQLYAIDAAQAHFEGL